MKIEAIILVSINNAFVNGTTVVYLRCVIFSEQILYGVSLEMKF